MGEPALQLVETNEVETKAVTIVDQAKVVKVTDSETYITAGSLWKQIGDMITEIKDTFDPICEAAYRAHKAATEKRAKYLNPLTQAQKDVKKLMSDYDAEQERIRLAEEARLRELARKEEEERKLQEAIQAELEGNHEAAEKIIQEPVQVAPVVVPKATPKMVGGPVYQTRWKFEITDAEKVPREYLMIDEQKIGKIVTALKDKTNIPGIRAFSTRV